MPGESRAEVEGLDVGASLAHAPLVRGVTSAAHQAAACPSPPFSQDAPPPPQQKQWGTRVSLSSNAIAGVAAGFTSCVLTHPLDVVKTRFQVHDGIKMHVPKYRGTLHALVTIGSREGVRTLYAGLSPNLLGSTMAWGSYFYCYNLLRGIARREPTLLDAGGQLGPAVNLGCATFSGFLTCLATNPIWLIKTRLQLQQGQVTAEAPAIGVRYNGMLDAFVKVFKSDGIAGLYKGLVPSLFLVSHGSIQFATYEEMKKACRRYNGGDEHMSTLQTLAASSLSKVVASTVTYPNQVVRSRLQQVDPNFMQTAPTRLLDGGKVGSSSSGPRYYTGTLDVAAKVLRHEGVPGFYKGIVPNLMRVVPSSCITFVVYETVAKMLNART